MTAASTTDAGETDTTIAGGAPRRRARAGWAWLAGGDGLVLRKVPSEASFFDGLGMWVAAMALVSGFGMTVAASQWWTTSITSVLWVLPLWAVLYCLIERLVLKSFSTSWAWNIVLTIPRLVLSLAIALVIGLPMAQVIYSGSINDELSKTTTARIHEATDQITRTYGAKIAAAQKEIEAAQARETRLRQQVTNSRFLADCEAGLAACSQTHKLGRGPYYRRDARRAAAAAAELKRARPQIAATISANHRKIAVWRAAESSQIADRVATIEADRDFLARQAALDRVQGANPSVRKYVQFFLAFLIAIDLVALMLKVTHLFSTGGAYERSAAALRASDLVDVHRLQERANVLTRRITLEAQAEQDADELRIRGELSPEPDFESDVRGLGERPSGYPALGGPARRRFRRRRVLHAGRRSPRPEPAQELDQLHHLLLIDLALVTGHARAEAGHDLPVGIQDRFTQVALVGPDRRAVLQGNVLAVDVLQQGGLRPRRAEGTMRTYRSHHLGPDPLLEPGATDITMDVDFSALQAVAVEAGAAVEYSTQRDFLTAWGLRDRLTAIRHAELEAARQGRTMERLVLRSRVTEAETLLHPRGLGDFRVLVARK